MVLNIIIDISFLGIESESDKEDNIDIVQTFNEIQSLFQFLRGGNGRSACEDILMKRWRENSSADICT
mgnify:CR=1 FL=1